MVTTFKYKWYSIGDIGAAATIMFDILSILTFMSLILKFGYAFPSDIIVSHIIPGTVVGVIIGNILCIYLCFKLAKKNQDNTITAMPFGLDAPSAIGFVLCITGPSFKYFLSQGLDAHAAGINAWQVSVGCLFAIGLLKLFCSFFINHIKSFIPQCALLGAIGGVAIALIGFIPLLSIFKVPTVGLFSLAIILFTMVAHVKLPFNISGIPCAIILSTILYYILIPFGLSGSMPDLTYQISLLLPLPSIKFFPVIDVVINHLPVVIPFALLVIFGTMSTTETARCMGDDYNTKDLMLVDAISTLSSAFFGGITQTTPYAGYSAYKKIHAKSGYLLINLIIVGIGGLFGITSFIVNLIPESAIAAVLLYVSLEITVQGFVQCDKKHFLIIIFAFLPSIARLLEIKLTDGSLMLTEKLQINNFNSFPPINDHLAIILLGNGFIITSILWASVLYFVIEREWLRGFICSIILAICSYFGIIHSVFINGSVYMPWNLPLGIRMIPTTLAIGYLLFGVIIILASRLKYEH